MPRALVLLTILALGACAPEAPITAADGPRCTWVYPRGFKGPERITKKNPVCNGDLLASWRGCTSQFKA
jgi:hypothetical protein